MTLPSPRRRGFGFWCAQIGATTLVVLAVVVILGGLAWLGLWFWTNLPGLSS